MERAIGTVRGLHGTRKRWLFEGSRMTAYGLMRARPRNGVTNWSEQKIGVYVKDRTLEFVIPRPRRAAALTERHAMV